MRSDTQTPPPDEAYYQRGEPMRRWGALLLVFGLIWLIFTLVSRVSFGSVFGTTERTMEMPTQQFAVSRVVISGANDDVRIVASSDQVELSGTRYGYGWNGSAAEEALRRISVQSEQRGDTLFVEVQRDRSLRNAVGRAPYVALQLAVPDGAQIEARLVSGDIEIETLRGTASMTTVSGDVVIDSMQGDVQFDTTSGDLEIRDLRGTVNARSVSGELDASGAISAATITSASGDVRLNGLTGNTTITTISGDVRISATETAQLAIETTSGDVDVQGTLSADSTINTISGNVDVELDPNSALVLDARSVSGELDVSAALPELQRERRQISGTLGRNGALLQINTVSGNVTITQTSR